MSEQFSHGRRVNFSEMIFALYRSDDISLDAEGGYEMTPKAMYDIQQFIQPLSIFNFDLTKTSAYKAIKKSHDEAQKQNESLRLVDVTQSRQLKQAMFNQFKYGGH